MKSFIEYIKTSEDSLEPTDEGRGFQPAMMLHGPTKKKILAKQKKNREKK